MEGCVQNVKLDMMDDKQKLEARIYRSQCNLMVITIADNNIPYQHCSITAGKEYINIPSVNLTSGEALLDVDLRLLVY